MFDVWMSGEAAGALWTARVLTAALLATLYLQSGLDKVIDRKGNIEWLTGHFAGTPLAAQVPLMVTTVTAVELAAGAASALGTIAIVFGGSTGLALLGAELSALALVMLFFGQRIAKDYAGAAVLVPYFLLSLVAVLLFA